MSLWQRFIVSVIWLAITVGLAAVAALLYPSVPGQLVAVLAIVAGIGWLIMSFLGAAEVLSRLLSPEPSEPPAQAPARPGASDVQPRPKRRRAA
ncbi:MAG: hypothetical protein ACF8R7_10025 [Phycisphaerales bacterium JB039]